MKHDNHESIKCIRNFIKTCDFNITKFSFHTVEVSTIRKHLEKLQPNKATGFDMLPPKVLNIGSDVLASSVSFLVNACFSLSSFPNSLKFAEISPVHKKGSSLDLTNYRPVSVLPSMSKKFEREMVNQLSTYFESILSQFISGFRTKHSCETVLLYMIENIKNYIDNSKFVCMVIVDLSRHLTVYHISCL